MRVKNLSRVKWNNAKDAYMGIEVKCDDVSITLDLSKEQWERLQSNTGWLNNDGE